MIRIEADWIYYSQLAEGASYLARKASSAAERASHERMRLLYTEQAHAAAATALRRETCH